MLTSLIKYLLVLCLINRIPFLVSTKPVVYDVRDHGATGDGTNDDTHALGKAWEATCKSSSSSTATMLIPSNMTFLTHPLYFKGPCNSQDINVEINGIIMAPTNPSKWRCKDDDNDKCDKWIHFTHVNGLTIAGSGTIHGRGHKWWDMDTHHKPPALKISKCKNVRVSGLIFKDNPRVHIVFDDVQSLHVSNVTITSPRDSPNTDGIHLEGSINVAVDHSTIGTGDDCISIGGGSSNLRISNITCGPGHGISIGSLGKDGANDTVENIHVSDVVFTRTTNGARIKTWQGGKGYARNITFERILSQESDNPIIINQFYCDHEHCKNHDSAVKVSNVIYREIVGTSKRETAVKLNCSATVPCENILMDNIYLLYRHGKDASSYCSNANGIAHGKIVPNIPCIISQDKT